MTVEIDLEKYNLQNFRSSVTLILTLDRVEAIRVNCKNKIVIWSRSIHTPNKFEIGKKLFEDGQTYVRKDRQTPEF